MARGALSPQKIPLRHLLISPVIFYRQPQQVLAGAYMLIKIVGEPGAFFIVFRPPRLAEVIGEREDKTPTQENIWILGKGV
jgi:hypothetical protein